MLICQKFDNAGYASPFIDCNIRDHEHKYNKREQQTGVDYTT